MAKTISTHNGSAVCRAHNKRDKRVVDKLEHIDPELSVNNLYLYDEAPRAAYARIFGDALADYNARQSRHERQIQDYYTHIQKDGKKHPVYEMIVQIGNKDDTGINAENEKQCLVEFYQGWAQRNPNLECIGAYIHADETGGTVHMHLDYVPVATGYTRGLSIQSSLVKALEQQGFTKSGRRTAQIQWESRENLALEKICLEHGIEVVHPKREQVKHLDTQLYKAQQEAQRAVLEAQEASKALDTVQAQVEDIQNRYAALRPSVSLQEMAPKRSRLRKTVTLSQAEYAAMYDLASSAGVARQQAQEQERQIERLQEQTQEQERQIERLQEQLPNKATLDKLNHLAELEKTVVELLHLALDKLMELWERLVEPLRERGNDILTFHAAYKYAAVHDPAAAREIAQEMPEIDQLMKALGGETPAMKAVYRAKGMEFSLKVRLALADDRLDHMSPSKAKNNVLER